MRLMLFLKLLLISIAISAAAFALLPDATLMFFIKATALGVALSIAITFIYPEIRGIRKGDIVSVVSNQSFTSFIGRIGRSLTDAKKNAEIRVRFDSGDEAVGIVESYNGILSPPKVRILYEEKIVK